MQNFQVLTVPLTRPGSWIWRSHLTGLVIVAPLCVSVYVVELVYDRIGYWCFCYALTFGNIAAHLYLAIRIVGQNLCAIWVSHFNLFWLYIVSAVRLMRIELGGAFADLLNEKGKGSGDNEMGYVERTLGFRTRELEDRDLRLVLSLFLICCFCIYTFY